jgi:hypothetical protein
VTAVTPHPPINRPCFSRLRRPPQAGCRQRQRPHTAAALKGGAINILASLALLWLLLVGGPLHAADTPRSLGTPSAKATIEDQTRVIYDKAQTWVHVFERANLAGIDGALGTELSGALLDGVFARLLVFAWTPVGKYGAEYYLLNGMVAFKFEAFEYFDSAAPAQAWRNFKGLAGWERRTYFVDGKLVYAESKGASAPPLEESPSAVQSVAAVLVAKLRSKLAEQ